MWPAQEQIPVMSKRTPDLSYKMRIFKVPLNGLFFKEFLVLARTRKLCIKC